VAGEDVGQAERGGEMGPELAGAEHPDRHLQPLPGRRHHRLAGLGRLEVAHQLDDIGREAVDVADHGPAQGAGGDLVGPRRAAEA